VSRSVLFFSYAVVPSAFGELGLVWQETAGVPKIHRVVLPSERVPADELVQQMFAAARRQACPAIAELGGQIQRFLRGEAVRFDLEVVALDRCSAFQRRVLSAEHEIPRGWVSTYGRIARHLGVPGGARAVGRALAHNPFPLIVPCHRAIQSDGGLGGFQGGLEMKRALLKLEGVKVSPTGKVLMTRVFY
jgi:methylated-DNA-[protein]-cysteine S-methyltransferase